MANEETTSVLAILCRVFWMLLGPMFLGLTAFLVIRVGNGWLTIADFAYLAVLGGMMLARWLEFQLGRPLTAEGEPATPGHLRRYLIGLGVIGLAVWVIANVIGNHALAS